MHSSSAQIASLQSTLGNQATRALMRSPAAGAISNVNHYEQEADRIADQVMTLPSLRRFSVTPVPAPVTPPAIQRACACGGHNSGGSCAACAENEGLQRKASAPGAPSRAAQSVSRVVRSTGHALDSGTRAFMERRLGYDFSAVRIHAGAQAAESARAVDAHAYTLGPHIVFASGQYAPRSEGGRRLLAHELVHVMQQGATSPPQDADNLANSDLTSPGRS